MAFAFAGPAGAQDYSAWAHHKDIYYDTSPSGAGVAGDVAGFPVLVRLDSAGFPFAEARGDGRDLRFSRPDGTPAPFEIDTYDSAAHAAAVWVLADTVKGNSMGALLRIHWGNASAAAADEPAKVFARANGFVAAWHLRGRYPTARINSAPGGQDAVPQNYDADEQTGGVIGYADSLDGGSPGDYLQTWQRFDSLSRAFTFSVWARPAAAGASAPFMDFGNGPMQDNLVLGRLGTSDSLAFTLYNGGNRSQVAAPGAIALGQWQHFAVAVAGKTARLYRNGTEIASGALADTIAAVLRGSNFMGKSNRAADAYYRGTLDEPEAADAARGPDWIKLAYENQKPGQTLLSFQAPVFCAARFEVPGDTAVGEATGLALAAAARCADQFGWSQLQGPALRILDPESETLSVALPRVLADTAFVLRFSARYGDSVRSGDVRLLVRNTVPEPEFSLPSLPAWNGRDSLLIRPLIENLSEVRSSPYPDLRAAWTVEGPGVDTLQRADGLLLTAPQGKGELVIGLCLDNGGPPVCLSMRTEIAEPVGLRPRPGTGTDMRRPSGYGADGRYRTAPGKAMRTFSRRAVEASKR